MRLKRYIHLLVSCLCLLLAQNSLAGTIVVVDSYIATYPWSETSRQGFDENISDEHQVIYFELDTKRIASTLHQDRADMVWKKIVAIKPDLVVTMDDNSLKYLGKRTSDANIPLVFMGVNNDPRIYFDNQDLPDKISGVLERPLLLQSISYIAKLIPMTQNRVLLVMDQGATSTGFYEKTLERRSQLLVDEIVLDVFMANNFTAWQEKFKTLSGEDYDAILVGSFSALQDKKHPEVTDAYILEWASEHSPIPLFTFWSHRIGHGKTIGGLVISGYEQGKSAAQKANTILTQNTFPLIEVSKIGEPIYSESQLSRWNIKLPDFIRSRSKIVE